MAETKNGAAEKIRAFIGIKLNTAALEFLQTFKQQQSKQPWIKNIRWTGEANVHITVRFLGDVTSEQISRITHAMAPLFENFSTFKVTMTTPRPFPSVRKARMLAALIHKNRDLQTLAENIEQIAVDAGVAPEDRPFTGHITVGRFRTPAKRLEPLLALTDTVIIPIERVTLFKSELKPTGAEYTAIADFPLRTEK